MEEIARVYSRSLFEVAKEKGKLDELAGELGEVVDALDSDRGLATFFFSPYFSSEEKQDGLRRAISGADPDLMRFLELLLERHRMPVIFRIRRRFEELCAQDKRLLPVDVTTAAALDPETVRSIGDEIGSQTGRTVQLASHVDPSVLGGIVLRVGNQILDASIRNRLDQLRKQVAHA